MSYTKKLISTSSVIILAGTSLLSATSAGAMSMESSDGSMSMSSGEMTNGSMRMTNGDMNTGGSATMNSNTGAGNDPYAQCLAYVKLKNLTGVDCKAKAEAMHQQIQQDRTQMNQGIRDDRMQMNQSIKDERTKMMSGQIMQPPMGTGELKEFLKTPLTPEEQTALKTLMQSHQTERDALMKDTTLTPEQKATKMKELMTTHMTALLSYVSTDKQEAFKKMMTDRLAQMKQNQEKRQEFRDGAQEQRQDFNSNAKDQRQDFKKDVQSKKQALSEKNKALLTNAISSFPLEKLQTILAKVEKALAVTKKERVIDQLNEIKEMIQSKIDSLTGTSSEDTIVQDILNTGASTTTP